LTGSSTLKQILNLGEGNLAQNCQPIIELPRKPKQVAFNPRENDNLDIIILEAERKAIKPKQLSLLDWGKLNSWKEAISNVPETC